MNVFQNLSAIFNRNTLAFIQRIHIIADDKVNDIEVVTDIVTKELVRYFIQLKILLFYCPE